MLRWDDRGRGLIPVAAACEIHEGGLCVFVGMTGGRGVIPVAAACEIHEGGFREFVGAISIAGVYNYLRRQINSWSKRNNPKFPLKEK